MNPQWYGEWVELHCQATGADARVAAALNANAAVMVGSWRATPAELAEVTSRLVAGCRTPKFPNEHSDAVGLELVRVREDRRRASVESVPESAAGCPACGGSGLVTVPHPRCVWHGRVVLHPAYGNVVTVAVLCDRPGCEPGRQARDREAARVSDPKKRRATLGRAEAYHGCDLVGLLRDHERAAAESSRSGVSGGDLWRVLLDGIAARVREAAG